MSHARLLDRVPSAKFVTTATLNSHDLRFHKKSKDGSVKCDAYLTGNPEHKVFGVVFEIDIAEKPTLDKKEGLGHGYEEKEVVLTTETGIDIKAIMYYATNIDLSLQPYQWYMHHVLTGAQENALPEAYVKLIKGVKSITDQNRERHEREMAIYKNIDNET